MYFVTRQLAVFQKLFQPAWILEHCCLYMKLWKTMKKKFWVLAINISCDNYLTYCQKSALRVPLACSRIVAYLPLYKYMCGNIAVASKFCFLETLWDGTFCMSNTSCCKPGARCHSVAVRYTIASWIGIVMTFKPLGTKSPEVTWKKRKGKKSWCLMIGQWFIW